jgi:hypothetical protein
LNEGLRVAFGIHFIGAANTIYGILLILFIIFMPRGIVGLIEEVLARTDHRLNILCGETYVDGTGCVAP